MARKRGQAAARLGALLALGDWREAKREARRLLDDAESGPEDREAAAAALRRTGPERGAAIAAIAGAALFLAAALLGILGHR